MIRSRNIPLFFVIVFCAFSIAGYAQESVVEATETAKTWQPGVGEEPDLLKQETDSIAPTQPLPEEIEECHGHEHGEECYHHDHDTHTCEAQIEENIPKSVFVEGLRELFVTPYDTLKMYTWTVDYKGDRTLLPFDTTALHYAQSLLTDSRSVAMGHLGNLGSPAQNMIFFERPQRSDFIFSDVYRYYLRQPEEFQFINTKVPYASITYNNGGKKGDNAEMFNGAMAINFGKKFNIGFDFDYLYGRGQYTSQSTKDINLTVHSSYISDRYELNFLLYNTNFLNFENGGLADDRYITDPDQMNEGARGVYKSKDFPVRFNDTWNHIKGQQYYFTHRYNLGYYQETGERNEEGESREQFMPVASIFHTFNYKSNQRRFVSNNFGLDTIYTPVRYLPLDDSTHYVYDLTSYWSMSNTAGISLREGFKEWVKFGLSAYINVDYRRFTLPGDNSILFPTKEIYNEFATKVGGELAKRDGSLFTYRANVEIGLTDVDAGELIMDGEVGSVIPIASKNLAVKGKARYHRTTQAFFDRHFHSRYFWWDNDFDKENRIYFGGEVAFPFTRTKLDIGFQNITNLVYYDKTGVSSQNTSNIQVMAIALDQNFKFGIFNWDNQLVYQESSSAILPLPKLSLYSNVYLNFKLVKVLTLQPGIDARFFTKYHAPYYDAPTQQFRLQNEVEIGNYPLINVYLNAHLKYTRFFVMGYNIGSLLFQTDHFSLAHYPLNPFYLRFGLSWNFFN